MSKILKGVLAPMLTPFADDGAPDHDAALAHARWLLEDGCVGLVPFGTTSEANSLAMDERMAMLEALAEGGISPDLMLPGTGLCALPETVRLTHHAVSLGCAGVLLLPPFYYKGVSEEGLFRAVAEVIEGVRDDRLRVYLYHIPPIAVIGYTPALVERLVQAFPNIVVGLKDSSGQWDYSLEILERLPGFALYSGSEDFLLRNLEHGGAGTITALANINARAIRILFDRWHDPEAVMQQEQLSALRETVREFGTIPALKAVLAHYRGAPGWAAMRPPLMALPETEIGGLISALTERHGFSLAF